MGGNFGEEIERPLGGAGCCGLSSEKGGVRCQCGSAECRGKHGWSQRGEGGVCTGWVGVSVWLRMGGGQRRVRTGLKDIGRVSLLHAGSLMV
jgi:hypothetical protein